MQDIKKGITGEQEAILSEHREMVCSLAKPGEIMMESVNPLRLEIGHMAVGISTEVAELLMALKDTQGGLLAGGRAAIMEELGDIEFYFYRLQAIVFNCDDDIPPPDFSNPILCGDSRDLRAVMDELHIASGNILDKAKRITFLNKGLDDERDEIIGFCKEFRGWLTVIYSALDFEWSEALSHNINKLLKGKNARYASGKYSDEQCHARADKDEKGRDKPQ